MNKNILECLNLLFKVSYCSSINYVLKTQNINFRTFKAKIAYLEAYFKQKLIYSDRSGTILTESGWRLLHELSNDYQTLSNKVNQIREGNHSFNRKKLKLILSPGMGLLFAKHIIPKLNEKFPSIKLEITTLSINYMLTYGPHIKHILENADILHVSSQILQLIDQDNWYSLVNSNHRYRLYGNPSYAEKFTTCTDINILNNLQFIDTSFDTKSKDIIKMYCQNKMKTHAIHFKPYLTTENEIYKIELAKHSKGLILLDEVLLNLIDKDALVPVFTNLVSQEEHSYHLLVKEKQLFRHYYNEIRNLYKNKILMLN